jgi:kynurenine formamidase
VIPPAPLRWIDLTLPLQPGMPVYPGDPPVAFLSHNTLDADGCRVTAVRLGTHAGTHLDAPVHFLEAGCGVDDLPIAALVGPARVIDVTDVPPGGTIGRHMLGAIQPGERVLLRTDWGRRFGEPAYYEEFPSLDEDARQELVEKRALLLGLETPSLCADHGADSAAHRLLLGAGVVILEGLTGLAQLSERVWLAALPLRLVGLDGSPCRVIAGDM